VKLSQYDQKLVLRRCLPVTTETTGKGKGNNISNRRCIIHCVPKKWRQNSNHYNYGQCWV